MGGVGGWVDGWVDGWMDGWMAQAANDHNSSFVLEDYPLAIHRRPNTQG